MHLIAVETAADTADVIADLVEQRQPRTLGVATGSSPEHAYRELVRRRTLARDTILYLVDEYVGLPRDSPFSYRATIATQLADPRGGLQIVGPDVHAARLTASALNYEDELRRLGGVDMQLLGIGRNGHIGFNEPGTPFSSRTRVATLSNVTRSDNARFFPSPNDVPTRCITQGLATISMANFIIIIATGYAKAAAVDALLTRPPGPSLPASALLEHPHAVLIADSAARSLLSLTDSHSHSEQQ